MTLRREKALLETVELKTRYSQLVELPISGEGSLQEQRRPQAWQTPSRLDLMVALHGHRS